MKLFLTVGLAAFALLAVSSSSALKCNSFHYNSLQGSNETKVTDCDEGKSACVSLQYAAVLSSDKSRVEFHQGLCSTPNVCGQFCRSLSNDDKITAHISQCQTQCCSSDDCNKQIL